MLVLTRKTNESIMIAEDIVVTVLQVRGDRVRIGIAAPATVPIKRTELGEKPSAKSTPARTRNGPAAGQTMTKLHVALGVLRMVTLLGEIVRKTKTHFLFSIASNLGDARNVGLSGQQWFPINQAYGFAREPKSGLIKIRISYALADLVSKSVQNCD